ncbi:MAG: SagB/ThcOx family dehydrogenase [Anaerolineae bacterium]|nr:SagB/ThcOx family dehydrogenase [Anaerolineae bacterium]
MTPSIASDFMRQTHHEVMPPSPQSQGHPQPPLELPYDPAAALVHLPDAAQMQFPQVDLRQVIEQRRSLRTYGEDALSLDELAALLWLTQGVQRVTKRPVTLRTVPSAGARHAFETFLLVNRVAGVKPGLYRYIALEHALLPLDTPENITDILTEACLRQNQVSGSAVTFFWVAVAERMTWRYPERGYRYLHLDAGHVCQNLYLAAEAIGCGVCAIAAFDDVLANQALGVDGEEQFLVYAATLGRRPPRQ